MFCFICGQPTNMSIGQAMVCDLHYHLIEKYLRPQPCHICERVAPVARFALDRNGSEMAICDHCNRQMEPDKHIILKCRCGHATGHLRTLLNIRWLEAAERAAGWPAKDYVGLALSDEPIVRDISKCPVCGCPGLFLFPRFQNGGRPQRFFSWPEFDRGESCSLEWNFPEIVKFFTGGEDKQRLRVTGDS